MRGDSFSGERADWRALPVEVICSWLSFTKKLTSPVPEKLVDGRSEKSDSLCTASEALQAGGLDPGAREIGVVVDCKTIRENNVLKTVQGGGPSASEETRSGRSELYGGTEPVDKGRPD